MIRKPLTARTPEELITLASAAATAIIASIIVATLYFGREIFVPVALAILLSFVLSPVVGVLQRCHIPRVASVVSVVLLAFAIIFGMGGLIAAQLNQLAKDLPRYQSTMQVKIQSVRGASASSGTLERAADMLHDLSNQLDRPKATNSLPSSPSGSINPTTKPVPVEVHQPDPGALESLRTLIAPLVHPLATTGIIIIFVIFILLQREDLRNRLIRLAGSHDLQRTTAALDDAAGRLSRLFLFQLVVNGVFGLVIGTGLWLIGVPSSILWGILAGVLRFIPFIGAIIAAAFPLTLAAAVDPGWSMLIWTLALFVIVEPTVSHVVEPTLYGRSTGLSPVAIVASATFWTALWGPIGLVLATPLTVCLVVLGRHVERLEFLDVMFGDRPALSPQEIFYQRMLAGDPTEAAEKAEEILKETSLSSYYDEVAIKGLQLAQLDALRGVLDRPRQLKIRDAVDELVNDLSEQDDLEPTTESATSDAEAVAALEGLPKVATFDSLPIILKEILQPSWRGEFPIVTIAAYGPLDESASLMFAHLLKAHGLVSRIEPAESLSTTNIFRLKTDGVAMICLSCLDVSRSAYIRYSVRRLRRKFPQAAIMLGCWVSDLAEVELEQLRAATKADYFPRSLRDAVEICLEAASVDQKSSLQATPVLEMASTAI